MSLNNLGVFRESIKFLRQDPELAQLLGDRIFVHKQTLIEEFPAVNLELETESVEQGSKSNVGPSVNRTLNLLVEVFTSSSQEKLLKPDDNYFKNNATYQAFKIGDIITDIFYTYKNLNGCANDVTLLNTEVGTREDRASSDCLIYALRFGVETIESRPKTLRGVDDEEITKINFNINQNGE